MQNQPQVTYKFEIQSLQIIHELYERAGLFFFSSHSQLAVFVQYEIYYTSWQL